MSPAATQAPPWDTHDPKLDWDLTGKHIVALHPEWWTTFWQAMPEEGRHPFLKRTVLAYGWMETAELLLRAGRAFPAAWIEKAWLEQVRRRTMLNLKGLDPLRNWRQLAGKVNAMLSLVDTPTLPLWQNTIRDVVRRWQKAKGAPDFQGAVVMFSRNTKFTPEFREWLRPVIEQSPTDCWRAHIDNDDAAAAEKRWGHVAQVIPKVMQGGSQAFLQVTLPLAGMLPKPERVAILSALQAVLSEVGRRKPIPAALTAWVAEVGRDIPWSKQDAVVLGYANRESRAPWLEARRASVTVWGHWLANDESRPTGAAWTMLRANDFTDSPDLAAHVLDALMAEAVRAMREKSSYHTTSLLEAWRRYMDQEDLGVWVRDTTLGKAFAVALIYAASGNPSTAKEVRKLVVDDVPKADDRPPPKLNPLQKDVWRVAGATGVSVAKALELTGAPMESAWATVYTLFMENCPEPDTAVDWAVFSALDQLEI